MKVIKVILAIIVSFVQIATGQTGPNGVEKQITTIEYWGNRADTTVQNIDYDINGNRIEVKSEYVSKPIKIDTNQVSGSEMIIESTWEDNSKTICKEVKTPNYQQKVCLDRNGIDTFYYSEFKLGRKGLPLKGIIVTHRDTSNFEINEIFSIEEVYEIQKTLMKDSEFIDFKGIIQFESRSKIIVIDLEEPRNSVEIRLNSKLKPKLTIKREWQKYFQMIFENKYSYIYQDDKLVEIKNVDMDGELEMVRTIEYKMKGASTKH